MSVNQSFGFLSSEEKLLEYFNCLFEYLVGDEKEYNALEKYKTIIEGNSQGTWSHCAVCMAGMHYPDDDLPFYLIYNYLDSHIFDLVKFINSNYIGLVNITTIICINGIFCRDTGHLFEVGKEKEYIEKRNSSYDLTKEMHDCVMVLSKVELSDAYSKIAKQLLYKMIGLAIRQFDYADSSPRIIKNVDFSQKPFKYLADLSNKHHCKNHAMSEKDITEKQILKLFDPVFISNALTKFSIKDFKKYYGDSYSPTGTMDTIKKYIKTLEEDENGEHED